MVRNSISFLLIAGMLCTASAFGSALPDFAYREFHVRLVREDGQPVAGAKIYGFCRELNLVWPRLNEEEAERNSTIWQESFLEKTDNDGRVKVRVPPGKWGFFAVGRCGETVAAGWSDFRQREAGERVELKTTAAK